jgi:predicted transcriptional regulator
MCCLLRSGDSTHARARVFVCVFKLQSSDLSALHSVVNNNNNNTNTNTNYAEIMVVSNTGPGAFTPPTRLPQSSDPI